MTELLNELYKTITVGIVDLWPYLVITIPIAVVVQLSGLTNHIKQIFNRRPFIAIVLATLVGAVSPFCSCGVIPIVATLLLSGIPLAPVMAFWIASPSMDPEIFFLSVATIGWDLAIWRFVATLIISLSAGFITHWLVKYKLINEKDSIKISYCEQNKYKTSLQLYIKNSVKKIGNFNPIKIFNNKKAEKPLEVNLDNSCCGIFDEMVIDKYNEECECNKTNTTTSFENKRSDFMNCCNDDFLENEKTTSNCDCSTECEIPEKDKISMSQILMESWKAGLMVVKFMLLAFTLKALINLYLPDNLITNLTGENSVLSIFISAVIGIPFYTSNLTALPMIGGLLEKGMTSGAALAFLISGPVTTLPAMAAVWGLVKKRVFILYLSISFVGALLFGLLHFALN